MLLLVPTVVQDAAVFCRWSVSGDVFCLRLGSRCQVCRLVSYQSVPCHRQLRPESKSFLSNQFLASWHRQLLLLLYAFRDLRFWLSRQLKAASCARCSTEMPPSKQCVSWFGVHRSRRVARRCNPTHACCCGVVPRLFGICLAGSISGGAGPFLLAGWQGPWSRICLGHRSILDQGSYHPGKCDKFLRYELQCSYGPWLLGPWKSVVTDKRISLENSSICS